MTSLAEAYEENVGEVGNFRRLYLGVGLFVAGALLVVVGILVSTTSVHSVFGMEWWQGREVAGILAGLGVPAVFVGVFTVLPASQRVRAAAAIGAGIAVLGVALFAHAYPYQWTGAGNGTNLTPHVAAVYFLGVLVTFWCLFVAVANFKTRNDPGGTVTLELTREGEVRTVEVEKDELADFDQLDEVSALRTELADAAAEDATSGGNAGRETGLGGVAFVGDTPDGETPTQTNQPEARTNQPEARTNQPEARTNQPEARTNQSSRRSAARSARRTGTHRGRGGRSPGGASAHASDGGTAANDIRSPLDDADPSDRPRQRTTDAYCGNCGYFEYVRTNEGMKPRCGYYGRVMDDMDACEEWEPNR